jgi:hypothetical protein
MRERGYYASGAKLNVDPSLERRAPNLNRHPGLDPGSTSFLGVAEKKMDAGSSPA